MEVIKNKNEFIIDAANMHYRDLNSMIKGIIANPKNAKGGHGPKDSAIVLNSKTSKKEIIITLNNVLGHRYIGDGIKKDMKINIFGVPGNDMAAFMDGPEIEVFGNAQDGVANTMNSGKIIIHGSSGDITGYSMRGGEIYIRDDVGWRSGIHMKSYMEKFPVIVIGGRAGNFLGEYMAGGIIIVLGLKYPNDKYPPQISENGRSKNMGSCETSNNPGSYYFEKFYGSGHNSVAGDFAGTGMHGGQIYIRGDIEEYKTGKEVKKMRLDKKDIRLLELYVKNFCNYFDMDYNKIISKNFSNFIKLAPYTHRPYGNLYAY